jgi:hypothetical protein
LPRILRLRFFVLTFGIGPPLGSGYPFFICHRRKCSTWNSQCRFFFLNIFALWPEGWHEGCCTKVGTLSATPPPPPPPGGEGGWPHYGSSIFYCQAKKSCGVS